MGNIGLSLVHMNVANEMGYQLEALDMSCDWYVSYRAIDRRKNHAVCFKVPAEEPIAIALFRQEIAIVERLSGCAILPLLDHDAERKLPYSVWEQPAQRLSARLKPGEGIDAATVLVVALELIHALTSLHDRGVIHRDLHPNNVVFREDGKVALTDFGLAYRTASVPVEERPLGRYFHRESLAPECIGFAGRGKGLRGGPEMDVYALGCLLRDSLVGTGQAAFPRWSQALVAPWLRDLCVQCLSHDPAKRLTLANLAAHLLQAGKNTPVETFPYEKLLAYVLQEQLSAEDVQEVKTNLATDRRWQAHHESLKFLDLELLAARQDAESLAAFDLPRASRICMQVAATKGSALRLLQSGTGSIAGKPIRECQKHIAKCVYCRRMSRLEQAKIVCEQVGAPPGEKLAREWRIDRHYRTELDRVTDELTRMFSAEETHIEASADGRGKS